MFKRVVLIFVSTFYLFNFIQSKDLINLNKNEGKTCWFDLMLNGNKAGYFSFTQYNTSDGNEKFIVRKEETFLKFKRSHHLITTRSESVNKMDDAGKLLGFQFNSEQGSSKHNITGDFDYKKGTITIIFRRDGNQKVQKLDIIKDALTEYQALMKLKKRGWLKGDSIVYSSFMTETGSYIKVNMTVAEIQRQVIEGKATILFKILRTIEKIPGIQSITWVDNDMLPYKGELIFPAMKYTLERTTKENALSIVNETLVSLNLARLSLKDADILEIIEHRQKIKRVILFLELKTGTPFQHELEGGNQKIENGNLQEGLELVLDSSIPGNIENIPIVSYPEIS